MIMETRKNTSRRRPLQAALLWAVAALGALPAAGVLVAPGDAHAVIGRPLTPISYAGVARRTSRRAVRRTYAASAAMTTLPAGCVPVGATYTCGTSSYQEVIDGGNVVYVTVE